MSCPPPSSNKHTNIEKKEKKKDWSRVARDHHSFRNRGPVGSSSPLHTHTHTHTPCKSLSLSFCPFSSPRGYFLVRKGRESALPPTANKSVQYTCTIGRHLPSKFAAFRLPSFNHHVCCISKGFPACREWGTTLVISSCVNSFFAAPVVVENDTVHACCTYILAAAFVIHISHQ